jgi:hypothetical protein
VVLFLLFLCEKRLYKNWSDQNFTRKVTSDRPVVLEVLLVLLGPNRRMGHQGLPMSLLTLDLLPLVQMSSSLPLFLPSVPQMVDSSSRVHIMDVADDDDEDVEDDEEDAVMEDNDDGDEEMTDVE